MTYQETLHYSTPTEAGVLGVLLLQPDAYEDVLGILNPFCFHHSGHRNIYMAIAAVYDAGGKIDAQTVANELARRGITQFDGEGVAYHLATLTLGVVSAAHLTDWAYILREKYARRKMLELSYTIANPALDPFEAATEAETALERIFDIKGTDDWRTMQQVGHHLVQCIDEAALTDMPGLPTGISLLDKLNGGLRPGDLVVIGARPSVGKSAFMGHMALHLAQQGHPVGLISLEMKDVRIAARMAALHSGVPHWQIDRGRFATPAQRQAVVDSVQQLAAMPIYLSQSTRVTVHDIKARARKLHKKHGLRILFIDYLQLIESTLRDASREQQVATISRALKVLAMDLNIPIVLLAQLNRESERRTDKRPGLADLRESGAIEQDADVVMLLHRDWHAGILTNADGSSTEHQADLFIPKWRDGTTTHLRLSFTGTHMQFSETG